jgi:hypothetical protein
MPFFWCSTWIKATCNSSAEAEVYALSECTRVAVHFKWICDELKIACPDRIPIHCDAMAAIGFFKNLGGQSQSKLKHIDLRAKWVVDMRESAKVIDLKHIAGTANPANFFTKVLGPVDFRRESVQLMSAVDVPENMIALLTPEKQKKAKAKAIPRGMEIQDDGSQGGMSPDLIKDFQEGTMVPRSLIVS